MQGQEEEEVEEVEEGGGERFLRVRHHLTACIHDTRLQPALAPSPPFFYLRKKEEAKSAAAAAS